MNWYDDNNIYPLADGPTDGFSEIRFHVDKALVELKKSGSDSCFELIQIEIKLKEALGWMDQIT